MTTRDKVGQGVWNQTKFLIFESVFVTGKPHFPSPKQRFLVAIH